MMEDLVAKAAIADLVHGYALAVLHRRYPDATALFAADGTFEVREGEPGAARTVRRSRFESPDALLAYLLAGADRPAQPIPMIHNLMIAVSGDTASASSLMEAQVFPSAIRTLGEYADSFRREDGTWRFASRRYTIFVSASRLTTAKV